MAHVGLRITDAERSGAFYRPLGFEWVRRDDHEQVHVLRHPGGIEINLIERADAGKANVLMDTCQRCPGYTHMALRVADVRTVAALLTHFGIILTEGPVRFGDGSTSVFVRDPDGNVVEFSEPAAGDGAAQSAQGAVA
jgi:catechol 2,3-dioxygenase-like lactoylglutathione lyase family enzyme